MISICYSGTSVSRVSRSLMCDDVRYFPSCPAIGESFTPNVMEIVGGSSFGVGIDSLTLGLHTVSDTNAFTPARVTISPTIFCHSQNSHSMYVHLYLRLHAELLTWIHLLSQIALSLFLFLIVYRLD